jgi:hypothetical protein
VTDSGFHAAEIINAGTQVTGVAPKFSTGEVQAGTDEDGVAVVLVDGPESIVGEEDITEDDPNQPVLARCWGNSVATGERVNVVTLPDGSTWVAGSTAGQPRCIGVTTIPGGAADVPVFATTEERISDLDTEAQILYDGHAIAVDVNVHLESLAATNTLIGRVRREDEEGNFADVGRFLRSNQMGANETIQCGPRVMDWSPEPGVYQYFVTVEASDVGWAVILNITANTAASVTITDLGPLPTSATRV